MSTFPPAPSSVATPRRATPLALASALVLLSAAGCASVEPLGPQPLAAAAQSAVQGRGNVSVHLDEDGVARVSGWVEDRISEQAVLRTVAARAEVRDVVDLIRVDLGFL